MSRSPAVLFEQDFIVVYQGLDLTLCRAIVERFDADPDKRRGRIGGAGEASYEDDTKVSWDMEIRNEGTWQELFGRLHPAVQACLGDYVARSPILRSFDLQLSGYKIQMYPKNEGHFRWHADSVGESGRNRVVAMVLYLNDVAQGGETEFFHQGIKISPRAGQLVLFPAGWNYMHCGRTPESGDKYIVSTFVKVKG